ERLGVALRPGAGGARVAYAMPGNPIPPFKEVPAAITVAEAITAAETIAAAEAVSAAEPVTVAKAVAASKSAAVARRSRRLLLGRAGVDAVHGNHLQSARRFLQIADYRC